MCALHSRITLFLNFWWFNSSVMPFPSLYKNNADSSCSSSSCDENSIEENTSADRRKRRFSEVSHERTNEHHGNSSDSDRILEDVASNASSEISYEHYGNYATSSDSGLHRRESSDEHFSDYADADEQIEIEHTNEINAASTDRVLENAASTTQTSDPEVIFDADADHESVENEAGSRRSSFSGIDSESEDSDGLLGSISSENSERSINDSSSEESSTEDQEYESCNLYPGSAITTANMDALLLAYFKKHRTSEAGKQDLIKLLGLALPGESNLATSAYTFNNRHKGLVLPYTHAKHCPTCYEELVENEICQNDNCHNHGEEVDPVTFFILPLKPQIQRIVKENWKSIEEYRIKMTEGANNLRDIQDGRVYKTFETEPQSRERKVFSIVLSSDGAPLIKSRKFSIWPLMCFLVELPPQERYKFNNVLCTGLWYGKQKPNVPLFLKSFVAELSDLNNGCQFEDDNGELVPSILRIQSIVPDLPAKAMLLNLKQYNGRFGCSTCKHPGRYDRELKSRLYEYTRNVSMRTGEESHRLADIAERTGSIIFGIKGKNVFGRLISIPENVPIDWMHCVCEGILKRQLFHKWFSQAFSTEDYSLSQFTDELDEIFLAIKVPHDFTRKPRSFHDLKHWKASEFRLFVLFAGLPCLQQAVLSDVLPSEQFYHFALLVTGLRCLHSVSVSRTSVETSQVLLDNFVRLLPLLYSDRDSTYNSHALLHLPGQVLDNGPLSFTSAFVFESFIAHLKNLFSGTRGIPKQMVEKLGIGQSYKKHVASNCLDNEQVKTMAKRLLGETRNTRKIEENIVLHEPIVPKKLHRFSAILNAELGGTADSEYMVSLRMKKEAITYHSTMYSRKGSSCSYIVQWCENGRQKYGKTVCYILHENVAYALVLQYQLTGINVCQELPAAQDPVLREIVNRSLIGNHFVEVKETDNAVLVNCKDIENRCLYIASKDGKGFLTVLDTTYEHD